MQINRLHLAWGFTVLATAAPALAETRAFDLGNSVRLEVRRIPKGRFLMGSPDSEAGRNADEKPHTVVLSRDFYLGRTAVTFAQWERFALETGYRSEAETGTSGGFGWNGTALEQRRDFHWRNTGYPQTPEHPVVMVTWEDSRQFPAMPRQPWLAHALLNSRYPSFFLAEKELERRHVQERRRERR